MPDIEQPIPDPPLPPEPPPWPTRVRDALRSLGGEATLQAIYRAVEEQFPEAPEREHWKAKVRQVVHADPEIERIENGAERHCPMCRDSYVLKSE